MRLRAYHRRLQAMAKAKGVRLIQSRTERLLKQANNCEWTLGDFEMRKMLTLCEEIQC
jgi:hypothetical protein